MKKALPVFIGIDVGTQGVRVMAVKGNGEIGSSCSRNFSLLDSRQEQNPVLWWDCVLECLTKVVSELKSKGLRNCVQACSVTSTSGTMIPLDKHNRPLGPAYMYSDRRSAEEAKMCREAAEREGISGYTAFHPSSGLPKLVWFLRNNPEKAFRVSTWAHAADYILGRLSGTWGITDPTNALKTGYDLHADRWPSYLHEGLGLPQHWFPKVVPSGTIIGKLDSAVAEAAGLPAGVDIVFGMTDGCASQLAAGSIRPGEWNTTIGTTLVVKGVTRRPITDPDGSFYNHRHPEGFWMPGGASNTGADWVTAEYAGADLNAMNEEAARLLPTSWLAYPLLREGERFPFVCEEARGFEPGGLTPVELFAAKMEGVAYVEKLAYDQIEKLSKEKAEQIHTAGGASQSLTWLQIRAHVLQRPIIKMKHTEGAVGAAILAAVPYYGTLGPAAGELNKREVIIEPGRTDWIKAYEEGFCRFKETLIQHGYYQERERER